MDDDNERESGEPFPPFNSLASEGLAEGIGGRFPPFTGSEELAGFAAGVPFAEIQKAIREPTISHVGDLADFVPALTLAAASPFKDIERLQEVIAPSLDALKGMNGLSRGIADQLRLGEGHRDHLRSFALSDYAKALSVGDFGEMPSVPTLDLPPIRNPICDTNDLLAEQREEIGRLSSLAARQIDIQTKQVDVVTQLFTAFVESSAAQDKANKQALSIARRNMWIAIGAAVVSALIGGVTLF